MTRIVVVVAVVSAVVRKSCRTCSHIWAKFCIKLEQKSVDVDWMCKCDNSFIQNRMEQFFNSQHPADPRQFTRYANNSTSWNLSRPIKFIYFLRKTWKFKRRKSIQCKFLSTAFNEKKNQNHHQCLSSSLQTRARLWTHQLTVRSKSRRRRIGKLMAERKIVWMWCEEQ